jgi:hypothetical protein
MRSKTHNTSGPTKLSAPAKVLIRIIVEFQPGKSPGWAWGGGVDSPKLKCCSKALHTASPGPPNFSGTIESLVRSLEFEPGKWVGLARVCLDQVTKKIQESVGNRQRYGLTPPQLRQKTLNKITFWGAEN